MSGPVQSSPPPGANDSSLVRVLLLESAHVVRRGLAVSLVADPTVRLVGAPRRLEEAYHLVPTCLADVVVVGTSLSDIPALAAVGGLRTQFPGVGVILVSAHPHEEELIAAVQNGAAAYLGLDVDLPTLRTTVRRVAAGEYLINQQLFDREDAAEWVRARFRTASSSAPPERAGIASLTEREREVLRELADGSSVDRLAQKLEISVPLTMYHLRSIIGKLAIDASVERPEPPRDDPPRAGVPVRPRGPWSPPGHLRTAVPLPGTEQER